jgi:Family of unknown function (DUF5367)
MSRRDAVIYALAGLGIWLNGAVSFRLGGTLLFHNGTLVIAAVAAGVAILVCLAFRVTFAWRKGRRSQAVTAAVLMALPGLFGEAVRQLVFPWATGLAAGDASAFAAVIFFGNAVLLTYAVIVQRRA